MLIKLSHVFKDYYQDKMVVPVLKDVNLHINEGEYVAIMGPSGSGKTTLMNIIGCLDLPTRGRFLLNGEDVLQYKEKELADLRLNTIGFVFQNFHLLQKESAVANVALPLVYAGVKKAERIERAKEALARVGLSDRADFIPTQLSGGQKQRVAIARAMVNNPKILLADEPTGALDSQSGKQIMELFEKLNEEGVTVIMITHDENIASCAKRVVRIIDGIVYEDGADPVAYLEAEDEAAEEQQMLEQILTEEQEAIPEEEPSEEESVTEEAEEPQVEEPFTEEVPVEEIPVEETPVEEIPVEEIPVEEIPVEETPVEEIPLEEIPVEDIQTEEIPEEAPSAEEAAIVEEWISDDQIPKEWVTEDPEKKRMTPEEREQAEKEWYDELDEMERIVDAAIREREEAADEE